MPKTKEVKKESDPTKKSTLILVGKENEIVEFDDIKQLIDYMQEKGWKLTFTKTKEKGWWIEFIKK
jgi:predicted esterase